MTASAAELEGLQVSLTKKLPYVVAIQAEVYDALGEYAMTQTSVNVEVTTSDQWETRV